MTHRESQSLQGVTWLGKISLAVDARAWGPEPFAPDQRSSVHCLLFHPKSVLFVASPRCTRDLALRKKVIEYKMAAILEETLWP